MSEEEIEPYRKFDKFMLSLGENLDRWDINVVFKDGNYSFIWCKYDDVRSDDRIKCAVVRFNGVQMVYRSLLDFLTMFGN